MSRSYKKYPHFTDKAARNNAKMLANKKVRRRERKMLHEFELGNIDTGEKLDLSDGTIYRRVYNSYDIHDFIFVEFFPSQSFMDSKTLRQGWTK